MPTTRTVLTLFAGCLAAGPAVAQLRTFEGPLHEGAPVSYCGARSESCGEDIAAAWCRAQGYDYASDWAARAGVDAQSRTVRLDDGAVCQGAACESFASITCGRESAPALPTLGAAARATVLSPNLRSTEVALDAAELQLLIPGCFQRDPGVFLCESIYEYEHCRTLMVSSIVFSCRAATAFESELAVPREAAAGEYRLELESDAEVRVYRGSRGHGRIKGEAEAEIAFAVPTEDAAAWCVQRESYLYHPTGPEGGLSEIGEAEACDEPVVIAFEPHGDDLLRAYDLCDSFAAWGNDLKSSIDVLVAARFELRSASPAFAARYGGGSAVIAPFLTLEAPLAIECRDG